MRDEREGDMGQGDVGDVGMTAGEIWDRGMRGDMCGIFLRGEICDRKM